MTVVRSRARRGRGPALVNTAVALALLATLGLLALTAKAPTPPTISAYAPGAPKQVKQSNVNSATGANGGLGATTTTTSTTVKSDRVAVTSTVPPIASARRCYTWPDGKVTQTEDPQSPACVAGWDAAKGNGGATAPGVTGNAIYVSADPDEGKFAQVADYFNSRYEFYGRKIVFTAQHGSSEFGHYAACDAAGEHTNAAATIQDKVFAALGYWMQNSCGFDFVKDLVNAHIMFVTHYSVFPESYMAAKDPYVWLYAMGTDEQMGLVGEWVCKQLAGQLAAHSGNPTDTSTTRKFGVVLQAAPGNPTGVSADRLSAQLSTCGQQGAPVVEDRTQNVGDPAFTTALQSLRTKGVTTVICMCDEIHVGSFHRAATSQGWFPEWVTGTYSLNDDPQWVRSFQDPRQLAHTFGYSVVPPHVPPALEPSRWAEQDVGASSASDNNTDTRYFINNLYQEMLLLASGIQMAGPNLTPATFAAALHKVPFPNPANDYRLGTVGMIGGRHGMTNDAVFSWWSTADGGPYAPPTGQTTGALCYVLGLQRFGPGQVPPRPAQDPYFAGPCSYTPPASGPPPRR